MSKDNPIFLSLLFPSFLFKNYFRLYLCQVLPILDFKLSVERPFLLLTTPSTMVTCSGMDPRCKYISIIANNYAKQARKQGSPTSILGQILQIFPLSGIFTNAIY